MKLRLRSLESKETHRIEVPNTCNLQQFKETITNQLSSSSSSSSSVNLLLSLNRKDELCGSSPQESLQSLGVTSGDLIYFSQNPFAFSSQNFDLSNTHKLESPKLGEFVDTQMEESSKLKNPNDEIAQKGEFIDAHMEKSVKMCDPDDKNPNLVNFQGLETVETSKLIEGTDGIDEMEVENALNLDVEAKFSVPSFLKKVFVKEVGDVANGGDHKLLVIAVHAVLIESGFVAYDPVSGMKIDGFHLADEWPSSAFGISLHYTLPEISSSEVVDTVVIKFQTLGKFVNVYGTLSKKGFGVHRVCLDEPRFVSALNFVWKKSDRTDSEGGSIELMKLDPYREIFEFWKIVKDGLSYPLLIELCEKAGLASPPCFMCLPTELKLKILESVSAVDVAKVACACSELRFVCSNNDLWRLKYEEEFGNAVSSQGECQWKAKFSSAWDMRRKRKRMCIPYRFREPRLFTPIFPGRRDPNPRGNPFVIGGDYDRLPALAIPQHYGWRVVGRNCDLGGLGP